MSLIRDAKEGAEASKRPPCLSFRGAVGEEVPFLKAIESFPDIDIIQKR